VLPPELLDWPNWLVSGEDKAPRAPRTGKLADVRDKALHATYAEASSYAQQYGLDIGFALTPEDPFVVIDLDAPANDSQKQRHQRIYEAFDTYAELSRSGAGVHIWCKGTLPQGARRDKVEVYPHSRYIICTGRTLRESPITDQQHLLEVLFQEMAVSTNGNAELTEHVEILTDREVYELALRAVNGDKFDQLCRGEWEGMYPSQSEADFALMDILCYYTRSNAQATRLFHYSALGKRDKAHRQKYIEYMLRKIRAEEPEPIDFSALRPPKVVDPVPNSPPTDPSPKRNRSHSSATEGGISYPPGLIGDIARYVHDSSTRPVPEIGVAAALALGAGVLGRQFNISNTGLNLYLILLAKTGVGKEGAASGIERLLKAARPIAPVVDSFLGPGTFASGQAIIRTLDEKPSFVSILGEFGLTLQDLSDANANQLTRTMRRVYLDLYGKSGKSGILYPNAYSDNTKNTKLLLSPAMTLLGESTPETFYEGLNEHHIADGLIPRFSIIEYDGDRPPRNPNAFTPPSDTLVHRFVDIVDTALRMQSNQTWVDIQLGSEAAALLAYFDRDCDHHIREEQSNGIRQLWNRAHLKALRIAGLLAAADRPHEYTVNGEEAQWAIDLVVRDVLTLAGRFESGDIGIGESKMQADVARVLKDYADKPFAKLSSYGVTKEMYERRVFPYIYVRRRCGNLSAFRNDKRGATRALMDTLMDLERQDLIVRVPKRQALEEFGTRGDCWYNRY